MVFNTTFSNITKPGRHDIAEILLKVALKNQKSAIFQLYRGGEIYWWRKPEYPEKITLSHNVVSSTPSHEQDSNSQC